MIYVQDTALTRLDWLAGGGGFFLSIMAAVFAIDALMDRSGGTKPTVSLMMTDILDAVAHARIDRSRAFLSSMTEALVLLFATATAVAILVDGRYRDFPTAIYLTPAISFIASRFACPRPTGDRPAYVLSLGLAAVAIGTVINESPKNSQALLWATTLLVLASPWVANAARAAYGRSRATTARPNTSPKDAASAL
jgi:hypothetical protein